MWICDFGCGPRSPRRCPLGCAAAALVGVWSPLSGLSIAAITLVAIVGFASTYGIGSRLEASFVTQRSSISDEVSAFVDGRHDLVAWQADQRALDRLLLRSRASGKILTRAAAVAATCEDWFWPASGSVSSAARSRSTVRSTVEPYPLRRRR